MIGETTELTSIQAGQVRQLILRSRVVLFWSLTAHLYRAIACCQIAGITSNKQKRLRLLLVAEATSAKFMKLRSQGKISESKKILRLMSRLEEELGGRLFTPTI